MLAIRGAFLHDRTQFRQRPTYEDDDRVYGTITWQPFGHPNTVIRAYVEDGEVVGNSADVLGPVSNLDTFLNDPFQGRLALDVMANKRNFNHVEGPNNNRNDRPDRNPDGVPRRNLGDAQIIERIPGAGWGLIWDGRNGRDPSDAFQVQVRGADQTNGRNGDNPFFKPLTFNGRSTVQWPLGHGNVSKIAGEGYAFQGLTDLKTFDFSKQNLGWDNDLFSRDFTNYNVSLEQVLFNGNVGFEFGQDFQTLFRDDYNAFSNGAARLTFDINTSRPIPNDLNYETSGDLS